jgi:CRISPR/Cas system CSM-associated protein Csm2 small subunit
MQTLLAIRVIAWYMSLYERTVGRQAEAMAKRRKQRRHMVKLRLSEIADVLRYRAGRATLHSNEGLAQHLNQMADMLDIAVAAGGEGQTNGETGG